MREDINSPALRQGVDFRGTPNAVERVTEHVQPGRTRASFFRYIRINLPRATRGVLLMVIAGIGVASAATALGEGEPFPFADTLLWIVAAVAALFVGVGMVSKARIWASGLVIVAVSIATYIGGVFGTAPYVWNGASVVQAAIWNLTLFLSLGYLFLYCALRYGMIVASPDNQNFMD